MVVDVAATTSNKRGGPSRHSDHVLLVLCYVICGALHELSHAVTAMFLVNGMTLNKLICTAADSDKGHDYNDYDDQNDIHLDGSIPTSFCNIAPFAYHLLIGRQTILPLTEEVGSTSNLFWIQHMGWMFSVLLAISMQIFRLRKIDNNNKETTGSATFSSAIRLAAMITALEAISTDLLGLGSFLPLVTTASATPSTISMLCGNFGVILLHHLWLQDKGRNALDCLEQMVNVTMMRGAQSGGVVFFQPQQKGSHQPPMLKGTRSRVVNKKRTDLSKEIRKSVAKDLPRNFPQHFVPTLSGHTRFATSSKASLDGTHPHQWTPATRRRVYNFHVPTPQSSGGGAGGGGRYDPSVNPNVVVENYITHNGDFEFYTMPTNGKTYDLDIVQKWVSVVTGIPTPAAVDSCAIAGVVDLLRTQGCFGLSARYAVCFALSTSYMDDNLEGFPGYDHFEKIGNIFEEVLNDLLSEHDSNLHAIGDSQVIRNNFALDVVSQLESRLELIQPLTSYIILADDEEGANLYAFCIATVNAFFDNDLFYSTKEFLKYAKGSFGLCVTSSLDAHRQICFAARGQTVSVGFFPDKKLICYGSEQAAVKAGLNANFPGEGKVPLGTEDGGISSLDDVDLAATRLDLDDLGGEIMLLDWGQSKYSSPLVSLPNRNLSSYRLMNGQVSVILHQESKSTTQERNLFHRMTQLSRNPLIKPLQEDSTDPVLTDIQDIPRICRTIQDDWHSTKASTSMNRLTAFNLSTCLRARLEAHVKGEVTNNSIDILLTGCEVSLWLAEQFASDVQKCFPNLRVQAISSNKLLGLFGQEIAVPTLGFPYSSKTSNMNDAIVIIVSHSGGTFAPLACSNLLQSATNNIFVVTSEWDTQIGKQLRAMTEIREGEDSITNSRIFSTEVGMRPAEPCSISVVATHQLLTNLFEYISVVILSDPRFQRVTGAAINEQDIQILERCNQMNIDALTEIVGVNILGYPLDRVPKVLLALREAGDLWSEHVLENARAYIMTFIYVFATVTSGWSLAYTIAYFAGLDMDSEYKYLIGFIDAAIYFWMPQINITLLRLFQGRNLLHRMVGRTVAIGDIPWVAQSAEAFLSKIFAVSYSIAGLNVLSGNPADHFVHRHTHRVVRGTLAIVGRPDGRLSALSTAEASVCLAVNQASSIQSWGGTCESITIGHNPFKLDLTINGIFLKRHRPLFLCERMLVETDATQEKEKNGPVNVDIDDLNESKDGKTWRKSVISAPFKKKGGLFNGKNRRNQQFLNLNASVYRNVDCSVSLKIHKHRSAPALLGAYLNIDEGNSKKKNDGDEMYEEDVTVEEVVAEAISSRKFSDHIRKLFASMDLNRDGLISEREFVVGIHKFNPDLSQDEAADIFRQADLSGNGNLDLKEFNQLLRNTGIDTRLKMPPCHKDRRGIIQIEGSKEKYFGEKIRKMNAGRAKETDMDFVLARGQHLVQELYETRIASMQRFVSMCIMFHHMGRRVERFFASLSCGFWSYRMDRTHSIMRIATTASPVSGADVRQRMAHLRLLKKVQYSIHVISTAYRAYKKRKEEARVRSLEERVELGNGNRSTSDPRGYELTRGGSSTAETEIVPPVEATTAGQGTDSEGIAGPTSSSSPTSGGVRFV